LTDASEKALHKDRN